MERDYMATEIRGENARKLRCSWEMSLLALYEIMNTLAFKRF